MSSHNIYIKVIDDLYEKNAHSSRLLDSMHVVYHVPIRPGKLNSHFIVTAHVHFQIFSKISYFRLYTAAIRHFDPAPQVLQLKGVASAITSLNLARFSHSFISLKSE